MARNEELFSIRIGNELPYDCKEDELREKFGEFGEIGDVYIPKHRDTGECRGFAFIRFTKKDDMEYCIDETKKDPIRIDDKEVKIEDAGTRPPKREDRRDDRRTSRYDDRDSRRTSRYDDRDRDSRRRSRSRSRSRDRYSSRRSDRRDRSRSRSRSRDRGSRR